MMSSGGSSDESLLHSRRESPGVLVPRAAYEELARAIAAVGTATIAIDVVTGSQIVHLLRAWEAVARGAK